MTLIAASSQLGFYFVTGSEIRWNTAKSVGNDPEGRKLMLSGLRPVLVASAFLIIAAWLLTPGLYVLIPRWLSALFNGRIDLQDWSAQLPGVITKPKGRTQSPVRVWTIGLIIVVAGLWIIRPSVPYGHMSGTLPVILLQVLIPQPFASHQFNAHAFPFPDLLEQRFWEAPHGHFPGWAPDMTGNPSATRPRPWWALGELPPGFQRWTEDDPSSEDDTALSQNKTAHFYNPVTDPLRITNMDLDLLEPLRRALQERDIPITHVVLVMMESARKDVFPFKAGSPLHEKIFASHDTTDPAVLERINDKLSRLSPVAEKLTGQSSGFFAEDANPQPDQSGMGGLNVEGMFTGSSLSFKSAVMNYCGVQPLPVNFMKEAESEIYQPCIMQILELFNRLKGDSESDDIHGRKWKSLFAQSITGRYDQQDVLNANMGFDQSIYKETLIDRKSKYFHLGMPRINYFGFVSTFLSFCV